MSIPRVDVCAEIGNKVPDSSVNRFAPDWSPRPEEVTERRSIGCGGRGRKRQTERERERWGRWASGSGLTRRSSQGWAHDQILSLIWRRFTQKSPFSLLFPPAFLDISLSLSPPNYPRQLPVDFTAPFPPTSSTPPDTPAS